jgi:Fe-S-cluster containining protein
MDELITNLVYISEAARLKKTDFEFLKKQVKNIPLSQFDSMVHPLVSEVTAAIDCTQCGNCCRYQEPGVSTEEIETLAGLKQMGAENFKDLHVAWDREGVAFLCNKPCIFLEGNICSVYHSRPGSCADFPGLQRPRLKWRMKQVEENYGICPIVFNVVEKLKALIILKTT